MMMQVFRNDNYLTRTLREMRRMFPAMIISVSVLYVHRTGLLAPTDPILLVAHRAALATIGFCVAHIVRQPAFPYLDLEIEIRNGNMSAALLVSMVYLAFVLGCTIGF